MNDRRRPDFARAQAERIASLVFIAARGSQLIFSAMMLANDRRRYDRPLLQAALLAGTAAESGWLSRRIVRAGGYDDRLGVWVDCSSAAAALLLSQHGLGTRGAAPWVKNVAIGAALGAASTRRRADTAGTVGTLCAAAIAAGLRAGGRDAHVAGLALAVNDAVSWTGSHVAARSYLSAHRRFARQRDAADALAVERAAAAAAAAGRSRQQERLHQVTIGVLRGIADSAEPGLAAAAARAEAARLRYALRTGGRAPRGLDQALGEVAATSAARGLRVELVTDELGPVGGASTAALRLAVRRALDAARELGGASRAVVRAVSSGGLVTVTVRDHGSGFRPGAGGGYESRLLAIGELLAPRGGELTAWSEPGRGVRIILVSSAGGGDDPADGVPDLRVGQRPAGHHEDSVGDDDVDAGLAGRDLGGSQHEVGVTGIDEIDGRPARDPLQAGPQQRQPGGDAGRRSFAQAASLTRSRRSGVGRNTQFRELPAAQARSADRTLLTALLAWRAAGLMTGAAALAAGHARYRSRGLAVAQLALAAGESAWYARRVLGRDRWSDPVAATSDAAAAAGIVVLGWVNLAAADRRTWINWPPWTFAANAICGQAMGVAATARAGAGAAVIIGAHALGDRRPESAAADSVALSAFFLVARLMAAQTRGSIVRLEQARGRAEAESRRLAQARERSAQLRKLHDHALQTLETIAGGRLAGLDAARSQARAEAERLDRDLSQAGQAASAAAPASRLTAVIAAHAGLRVEFEGRELPDLPEAVILAFCGAADEALTNVRKHAHTDQARVAAHDYIVLLDLRAPVKTCSTPSRPGPPGT